MGDAQINFIFVKKIYEALFVSSWTGKKEIVTLTKVMKLYVCESSHVHESWHTGQTREMIRECQSYMLAKHETFKTSGVFLEFELCE